MLFYQMCYLKNTLLIGHCSGDGEDILVEFEGTVYISSYLVAVRTAETLSTVLLLFFANILKIPV